MNVFEACKILDVDVGCDEKTYNSAFRKLAAKHHPDKSGDENQFKKINEAYQFLKKNGTQEPPTVRNINGDDISAIFDQIFGGRSGFAYNRGDFGRVKRIKPQNGGKIVISFEESVIGCEREVEVYQSATCDKCSGTGFEIVEEKKDCPVCDGKGVIKAEGKEIKCSACRGTGKQSSKIPCRNCGGHGKVRKPVKKQVRIQPGIPNGAVIKIAGAGENGADLIFTVFVKPDKDMVLNGRDIISVVTISLLEALKGTTKEVRTVYGKKKLKIPAGVKHKSSITARNSGVPPMGNHIYIIEVEYPELTDELEKALQQKEEVKE